MTIYLVWQLVYYELIVIRKKSKIEAGERINSYSTMSKGKGPVANLLGKAPPKRREPAFMRKLIPAPPSSHFPLLASDKSFARRKAQECAKLTC